MGSMDIAKIDGMIYTVRGHRVMVDSDLAVLYGVETGNLNKAVNRNRSRFPNDFMFQMTKAEFENLRFQFGISSWGGRRYMPRVFTEHGVVHRVRVDRTGRRRGSLPRPLLKKEPSIAGGLGPSSR
jgi:hypothetical protein